MFPDLDNYIRAHAAFIAQNHAAIGDIGNSSDVAKGDAFVAVKQPFTGAVARTQHEKNIEIVSVLDFGAKGDAVTNDTAAIQAAIDYARANQNAKVYFPPHQPGKYYKTTASIIIDGPVKICGDGPNSTLIFGDGLSAGAYVLDFDCQSIDTVEHIELFGFTVRSGNGLPNGLRLKNVAYALTKDVRFYGLKHGVVLEGTRTFSNTFENVNAYAVTGNTVRFAAGFSGGGHFNFIGCTFTGDTGFYFPSTAAADSINFNGCNFEQCVTNSLFVGGSCRGLSIVGCRTEGCDSDDFQINPGTGESVEGLVITGTSFTADASGSYPITLGGAGGAVRGFSITGNQVENAGLGASFVKLNGDGESGIVAGNSFAQSNTTPTSARRAGVVVFGNENSSGKCDESWGDVAWGVQSGSWTPIDASLDGLTFASAEGYYTRIGNLCFVQGAVVYPTTAATAVAQIGGLPFTVAGSSLPATRAGLGIDYTTVDALTKLALTPSTQQAVLWKTGAAPATNVDASGAEVYFSGMYRIA